MEEDKELDYLVKLRNDKLDEGKDVVFINSQIMAIINKRQLDSWNVINRQQGK